MYEEDPTTASDRIGMDSAKPSAAGDTLRDYLAAGKPTCPSCRYELRGVETSTCPECGWSLQLQLKPRLATVPHWLFGLMIYGWLAIMGIGGTVANADRFWNYFRVASARWMRQNNNAQSQAIVQQFLNQTPGPLAGRDAALISSGAAAVPVMPPKPNVTETVYLYFVALSSQDQVSMVVFLAAMSVGVIGLLLVPMSRRCSPRFNAIFVGMGSVVFGLLAVNYLITYVSFWMRRF